MRIYVLYGFGIALSIAGIAYLATEYVRYLTEPLRLLSLLLTTAMFAFFGKYFQEKGW
ncbi:MAG: hypothetical protein HYX79_07810 [Chloroflexi bacterium]|nr:hypothetical protein [Chloroflexota bacterium]